MTTHRIGWTAVAVLGVLAAIGFVPVVLRLPLMLELPNEGWNAIHALHAFSRNLYPDPSTDIVNNYPPLWYYLTGALAFEFGDPILPGRVIGIAALVACICGVFALARALGATPLASALAAAWLAAVLAIQFRVLVGTAEPQMLASAMIVAAAAMVVRSRSPVVIACAALLMVLGGLCKQVVIALPLASIVWLALYRRSLFGVFLLVALAAASIAIAALLMGYGANLVANVTVPRVLSIERLGTNLGLSSRVIVPLIAFGWLLTRASWPLDAALGFAALALFGAYVEIVAFGSALGVSINIAFDLMIASAVALALVWDRADMLPLPRCLPAVLAVALILRLMIGSGAGQMVSELRGNAAATLRDQAAGNAELRDRLRTVSGPVACEHLSVCVWSGHASSIDLWKLRFERTLDPILDRQAVLSRIGQGEFAAVTLFGRHSGPQDDRRFTGLSAALAACCDRPIYIHGATLYLRRGER